MQFNANNFLRAFSLIGRTNASPTPARRQKERDESGIEFGIHPIATTHITGQITGHESYHNPMNQNPLNKGMIEQNSIGIGEISGDMVEERAKELAMIAGRPLTNQDRNQSLRELTGGDEMDARQAMFESFPEDKRWDPIPVSTGHQAEVSASEEEDEDGHGQTAQLFEEGVSEAAHDQMRQAAQTTKGKGF